MTTNRIRYGQVSAMVTARDIERRERDGLAQQRLAGIPPKSIVGEEPVGLGLERQDDQA